MNVEKFIDGLHEYLAKQFAPLLKRLEALENRQPEKGEKGEPGQSVTPDDIAKMMDERVNTWALQFERMAQGKLEKAVDNIPIPLDGKNGRDALELKDFSVELLGRYLQFKYRQENGETIERSVEIPVPVYEGVYKSGEDYVKGDFVTFSGSLWHCNEATTEKPGQSKAWTLAVKRGRDAKEGGK